MNQKGKILMKNIGSRKIEDDERFSKRLKDEKFSYKRKVDVEKEKNLKNNLKDKLDKRRLTEFRFFKCNEIGHYSKNCTSESSDHTKLKTLN